MKVHSARASLLAATLVTGFLAVAAPAWGQVFNEDLKLLPDDGPGEDYFGYSIAIDSGVVAVGAVGGSGSSYLFEAITGDQIAKFLPDDQDWELEYFGWSIAIDDGVVAVGAPQDDMAWHDSGSVYLFDASNGDLIVRLRASDEGDGDGFGWSVALDNGVVAVGSYRDDDNGQDSGSLYLFDVVTGEQLDKLLPSDGATDDRFG